MDSEDWNSASLIKLETLWNLCVRWQYMDSGLTTMMELGQLVAVVLDLMPNRNILLFSGKIFQNSEAFSKFDLVAIVQSALGKIGLSPSKKRLFHGVQMGAYVVDSVEQSGGRTGDQKGYDSDNMQGKSGFQTPQHNQQSVEPQIICKGKVTIVSFISPNIGL
ncbi:hypothetical protein M9H77_36313 [Catharanthus roseus]|uniref:Uncharacterized protein n=1 Tax=Catharanthus roseus TaxID=4058 RepID=A0ACB9ZS92_CATRO|nr:hypothetical protein M9H77_36313 [Catharanthus roseus]